MKLIKSMEQALKNPLEVIYLKLDSAPDENLLKLKNLKDFTIVSKKPVDFDLPIDQLLNLTTFSIITEDTCNIGQDLFRVKTLQSLKIKAKKLKLSIPAMPTQSLLHLFINNCSLEKIPETLYEFMQLQTLNLANNKITSLSAAIGELTQLQRLVLDSNELTKIPIELKKLPKLTHLSLDNNKFSDVEKAKIQKEFNIWFS